MGLIVKLDHHGDTAFPLAMRQSPSHVRSSLVKNKSTIVACSLKNGSQPPKVNLQSKQETQGVRLLSVSLLGSFGMAFGGLMPGTLLAWFTSNLDEIGIPGPPFAFSSPGQK